MASSTLTDELAALARPLAKKLVRRDDARRARIFDAVTGGGTRVILGDGTTGPLPSNQHGTIEDVSVLVDFPAYSLATELETLLGEIIADLGDDAEAVAVAGPDYLYWTAGASATDPEWLVYGGATLRRSA